MVAWDLYDAPQEKSALELSRRDSKWTPRGQVSRIRVHVGTFDLCAGRPISPESRIPMAGAGDGPANGGGFCRQNVTVVQRETRDGAFAPALICTFTDGGDFCCVGSVISVPPKRPGPIAEATVLSTIIEDFILGNVAICSDR